MAHTIVPTPQSVAAPGMKSSRLPISSQGMNSNSPCWQPRTSSGASTWTTSQVTVSVCTMERILARPPL